MEEIKIAILGFGTVGSSVYKLLQKNSSLISDKTGKKILVKKILESDPRKKHKLIVRNPALVLNDPKIDVVVEAIGGAKKAKEYVLKAISKGKHVVTSNKELIAKHYREIFSLARKNKVNVLFEGAVGGGIPIISPLSSDLVANKISEVYGIVNGTTNYILSFMSKEGKEFKRILEEAQKKGFAEADPKMDIDGYDAAYKAVILAMTAFGCEVDWRKVSFEGISKITKDDIDFSRGIGYVIKLLAIAKMNNGALDVRVHPALVSQEHPLASIEGSMNAIYVKGNGVGEVMFYGPGAGGFPTASAIISDLIRIKDMRKPLKLKKISLKNIFDTSNRYYIRLQAPDRHGVLAGISKAFADEKVSIHAVVQKEAIDKTATIVILTHEVLEKSFLKAIKKIKSLPVVNKISNIIRVGI
jgi:homoserine dehydrogenase